MDKEISVPIIFNAALDAQGVSATESLYVDDCKQEADGEENKVSLRF